MKEGNEASPGTMALKENKDDRVHKDLKALRVIKEQREIKGFKEPLVIRAKQVTLVQLEAQEKWAQWVFQDKLGP